MRLRNFCAALSARHLQFRLHPSATFCLKFHTFSSGRYFVSSLLPEISSRCQRWANVTCVDKYFITCAPRVCVPRRSVGKKIHHLEMKNELFNAAPQKGLQPSWRHNEADAENGPYYYIASSYQLTHSRFLDDDDVSTARRHDVHHSAELLYLENGEKESERGNREAPRGFTSVLESKIRVVETAILPWIVNDMVLL